MPTTSQVKSIQVLLVDDSEDDIILLRQALEASPPLQLTHAFMEGEEVLQYLENAPELPDLIFMDINMPRMNGFEVLEAIQQREHIRDIPVIMLTTSNRDEDMQRAYALGASTYVSKPFNFEEFVNTTRSIAAFWRAHINGIPS